MDLKSYSVLCSKLETSKRRLMYLEQENLIGGNCWDNVKRDERSLLIRIEQMERQMSMSVKS